MGLLIVVALVVGLIVGYVAGSTEKEEEIMRLYYKESSAYIDHSKEITRLIFDNNILQHKLLRLAAELGKYIKDEHEIYKIVNDHRYYPHQKEVSA